MSSVISEAGTGVAHFDEENRDRQSGICKFEHSTVPFKDILRLSCICALSAFSEFKAKIKVF